MRRQIALIAFALLLGVLLVADNTHAQTTVTRPMGAGPDWQGQNGFWGFVDSTWESSSNPSAEYTTVNAPTGKRFHYFEMWSTKLNDAATPAELFTISFWRSSTDSTSIVAQRTVRLHEQGKVAPLRFYVDAFKASLTTVGTGDSLTVRGYYK